MRRVDLVGPKGYEHGWKFVGVPGVTPHSELLRMRKEARAVHPQGHPERLKAEKAVRHSRKLGATQQKATGARKMPVTPGEGPRHEARVVAGGGKKMPTLAQRKLEQRGQRSIEESKRARGIRPGTPGVPAQTISDKQWAGMSDDERLAVPRSQLTPAQRQDRLEILRERETPERGASPSLRAQVAAAEKKARKRQAEQDRAAGRGGTTNLNPMPLRGTTDAGGGTAGYQHPLSPEDAAATLRQYEAGIIGPRDEYGRPTTNPAGLARLRKLAARADAAQAEADRLLKIQREQGKAAAQQEFLSVAASMLSGRSSRPVFSTQRQTDAYREMLRSGMSQTEAERRARRYGQTTPKRRRGRRRGPDYRGIGLSAETPRLVATPAPLGKPGGPGLYHLKGAKLPNYIENMRNALMRGGMSEGRATATAISRCKVLALTSKHPEVKAAAAAAIAELKATAARAKASHANEPATVVELFNPYHAPPGTGGGQFTSKGGGGAGSPGTTPSGRNPRAQKAAIMHQVAGLRERIGSQTRTLVGLKAQRSSLSASVGGSKATGTTKAKKAAKGTVAKSKTTVKQKAGAKRKATSKSTGASKAASRAATMGQIARLTMRINSLTSAIQTERGQVRSLLAKARSM